MNIAFFLTPKSQVVWLPWSATFREALASMVQSGYTAIPVLDEQGRYVGTLGEGDLLRELASVPDRPLRHVETVLLREIPRRLEVQPVPIDAEIETLLERATEQNFVPVADSRAVFVGIVTRRRVIRYFAEHRASPDSADHR